MAIIGEHTHMYALVVHIMVYIIDTHYNLFETIVSVVTYKPNHKLSLNLTKLFLWLKLVCSPRIIVKRVKIWCMIMAY